MRDPAVHKQIRATFRNPVDAWLRDEFVSNQSSSGEDVTFDSALSVSAVYACIRVIAETVGLLPLLLYRRIDEKSKERATSHPVYKLLHDQPNPETAAGVWEETWISHALSWGNGYVKVERNGAGVPVALWNMRPDRIKPERVGAGNQLVYARTDDQGRTIERILAENMLHVPALGFDGLVGYSPIAKAREAIGLAIASQKSAGSLFSNGSTPAGVLEAPQVVDEPTQKRLRKSWDGLHGGAGKSNRTAILEQGMKYKPISFTPEDSQFLESRQFSVAEICRWFRVPPHKVQDLSRSTFANIEHQSIEFVVDTISPWINKVEQEITRKLLGPTDDLFAEHMVDALLRGDSDAQSKSFTSGLVNGYFSINDVRSMLNMNPVEGGDVYRVQAQMTAIDEEPEPDPPPVVVEPAVDTSDENQPPQPDTASVRAIALPVLRDAFERIQRIERDKLRRAWKRPNTEFGEWRQKFYGDHVEHVTATLSEPVGMAARMCGQAVDGHVAGIAATYCERSQDDIDAAFAAGGDAGIAFDECLDRWQADRATDEAAMVMDGLIT